MLKMDNVTFKYGKQTIIDGLSYTFTEGVTTAITGTSGIGKTTVLYLLAELVKPLSGTVTNDKKTAVIFQEDRLFPWLNALENITVVGADISRATELLEKLFPSENVMNKFPDELSGGMKQRISIARALSIYPDILLMDEPFKGLDAQTRSIAMNTVFAEMKDKTCILITHNEDDLEYAKEHLHISTSPITKFDLVKSSNHQN